jgi:hypothetical protein
MHTTSRAGVSLLETMVALTLFAGVLLSLLGTGQLILARLYETDVRLRAGFHTQSLLDSLRAISCTRLTSGGGIRGPFSASWVVTDLLDAVQLDVVLLQPRRGGLAPLPQRTSTIIACPEP